ncbi:MAG: molybdopterin molybdenumtransferase MoeA, partial [Cycloclasticus sp.]|nr:molybdopterin molybdenumtransferase MoeA [Cycloclasticus sp.]
MNRINKKPSCADEQESDTLTVSQALSYMLNAVEEKNSNELIHLSTAVDRVLGAPIISSINVPSHCNSAVDGYAIRSEDLPRHGEITRLPIVAQVVAGHPYHG